MVKLLFFSVIAIMTLMSITVDHYASTATPTTQKIDEAIGVRVTKHRTLSGLHYINYVMVNSKGGIITFADFEPFGTPNLLNVQQDKDMRTYYFNDVESELHNRFQPSQQMTKLMFAEFDRIRQIVHRQLDVETLESMGVDETTQSRQRKKAAGVLRLKDFPFPKF